MPKVFFNTNTTSIFAVNYTIQQFNLKKPMLKSADIKAIAKQVALEMYALNDEVLSLSDVAMKLNKSEAAIKQMCYRGQLPFHKQHKTYYFSKNEITNFLLKKVNV